VPRLGGGPLALMQAARRIDGALQRVSEFLTGCMGVKISPPGKAVGLAALCSGVGFFDHLRFSMGLGCTAHGGDRAGVLQPRPVFAFAHRWAA
jgi:hypothetical protein